MRTDLATIDFSQRLPRYGEERRGLQHMLRPDESGVLGSEGMQKDLSEDPVISTAARLWQEGLRLASDYAVHICLALIQEARQNQGVVWNWGEGVHVSEVDALRHANRGDCYGLCIKYPDGQLSNELKVRALQRNEERGRPMVIRLPKEPNPGGRPPIYTPEERAARIQAQRQAQTERRRAKRSLTPVVPFTEAHIGTR